MKIKILSVMNKLKFICHRNTIKAILHFIYNKNNKYNFFINDKEYILISSSQENKFINKYNESLYKSILNGIPSNIHKYIKRDLWINDYGVKTFQEWWEFEYSSNIELVTTLFNINFYIIK
jgi:hypothetical protein